MTHRSHAFSTDEAPTKPACRDAKQATSASNDDDAPTTLRRSSMVRARTAPRRTPPPLPRRTPPPLPAQAARLHPQPAAQPATHPPAHLRTQPPPLPRPRIRSLASILEPNEEEPCAVLPARLVVLPPDPEAFPSAPRRANESTRWLVRIALMLVVLFEELLLATPAGTLHPPRDFTDASTMLVAAVRSSVSAALRR